MTVFRSLYDPAPTRDLDGLIDVAGRLPEDYLFWLRSHNGGQIDDSSLYWVPGNHPKTGQMTFRDVNTTERVRVSALTGGGSGAQSARHPSQMLGFASNGGGDEFLISLLPESWGSVWFCSMHEFESEEEANTRADGQPFWGNTTWLADSFGEFMLGIVGVDADFTGTDSHVRGLETVGFSEELLSVDGQYSLGQGVVLSVSGGGVVDGGSERWTLEGGLHRVDHPAWISGGGLSQGGSETWSVQGRRHRTNGPAFQRARDGGYQDFWVDGVRHRVGGPACFGARGVSVPVPGKPRHSVTAYVPVEEWFVEGRRHRLDGPAVQRGKSLAAEASVEWWQDDRRHRLGGPAFVSGGRELWFRENRLHRIGGPAVSEPDGTEEFWVDGVQV